MGEQTVTVSTLLNKATLLGATILLAVMMWAGPASAAENGLIYWSTTGSIAHVDPTASNPQPTWVTNEGDGFDISRDGQTLVYQESYFGWGSLGPLYTFPLGGDPYYDSTQVQITNKSTSSGELKYPRFSPDGNTIYFVGKHTLDPPEGVNDPTYDAYAIYSVPTSGGEATKISINVPNDDGTPTSIYSFALSHDGTKFALGAKGGIFSVPVSGGDATRVTNDSCQRANFPRFSADDQMIVYNAGIWSGTSVPRGRH
jgi:Tol biopolymer transport system component